MPALGMCDHDSAYEASCEWCLGSPASTPEKVIDQHVEYITQLELKETPENWSCDRYDESIIVVKTQGYPNVSQLIQMFPDRHVYVYRTGSFGIWDKYE